MTASVVSQRVSCEGPTIREEMHLKDDIEQAFLDASKLCLEVTVEECWMAFVEKDDSLIQRGAGTQKATKRRKAGRRFRTQNKWHENQSANDDTTVSSSLTLHSFDDIPEPKVARNLLRSRASSLFDLDETETFDKSEDVRSTKSNGTKRVVQGILKNKTVDTRDEPSAATQNDSDANKVIKSSSPTRESPPGRSRATSPFPKRSVNDDKSIKSSATSTTTSRAKSPVPKSATSTTTSRAKSPVPKQLAKDDKSTKSSKSTKSTAMSRKGINKKDEVEVKYKMVALPNRLFAKGRIGTFLVV